MTSELRPLSPALLDRPKLGENIPRSAWGPFLAICHFDPQGVAAGYDSLHALQTHSRFQFEILNLWPMRALALELPEAFSFDRFAGVYVHQTVSYNGDNLAALCEPLKAFKGVKILAKQDEQRRIAPIDAFAAEAGVDLVLTCLDLALTARVYPRATAAGVQFERVLTGYVTDALAACADQSLETRAFDIVYRGSRQPLSFGRLGYEKRAIGDDVAAHPLTRSLRTDISSRWEDRRTGQDWTAFLSNARAVLGVESGSEIFDFDGAIEAACDAFQSDHQGDDPWSEAYYRKAEASILRPHEGNVRYAQISPRHFEAAATRTLQILYEGDYSGIFVPDLHYLPLKRDLSNFAEILDVLRDDTRVREITARAHADIIASGRYSWKHHVGHLDDLFDALSRARLPPGADGVSTRRRIALLCAGHPDADPRIGWMTSLFEADSDVVQFGMRREPSMTVPDVENLLEGVHRVCLEPKFHGRVWRRPNWRGAATAALAPFDWLESCYQSDDETLNRMTGAWDATDQERHNFRMRCRHLFDVNGALVHAVSISGAFDAILCADLEALLAGCALSQAAGCRLIYDAHEFWPHSSDYFPMWEREFWTQFEFALTRHTDLNVSVNPLIANALSQEYGVPFLAAANAIRLDEGCRRGDVERAWTRRADAAPVDFLFLGGFAPGRGIDLLINAWTSAPEGARLLLRGPDSEWKSRCLALAKDTGRFGTSILFPPPVPEADLVAACLEADVGIIPYEPNSINNRLCCPNKMSQYMSAGLPLLANRTEFVGQTVEAGGFGEVVDFKDRHALVEAIHRLSADGAQRIALGRRARDDFESRFHWEIQSRDFALAARALLGTVEAVARPATDFSSLTSEADLARGRETVELGWRYHTARAMWRLLPTRLRQTVLIALRSANSPTLSKVEKMQMAARPDH